MKKFLQDLYQSLYKESLVKVVIVDKPQPVIPVPEKTNREKLLDIAMAYYNTDPTPENVQPNEFACVEVLTTILSKLIPFSLMTYTPTLLTYLQKDKRFKIVTEMKEGVIILSPTLSGNGSRVGHVGICSKGGKILSNSSATGLFTDKFDQVSWIQRYSREGGLSLYLFELI